MNERRAPFIQARQSTSVRDAIEQQTNAFALTNNPE
jgi:hypothetical protein